jgi:hypothetical protein
MDLDTLREACRALLAKRQELEDITARRDAIAREVNQLTHSTLPTMFYDAGVDRLGLPAEGNRAAYDAKLKPYYRANIAADWPDEKRSAGFEALVQMGLRDLIKYTVTVRFAPGDTAIDSLLQYLDCEALDYESKLAVAWNTLSAALADLCTNNKMPSDSQIEAIGGTVGHIVELVRRDD